MELRSSAQPKISVCAVTIHLQSVNETDNHITWCLGLVLEAVDAKTGGILKLGNLARSWLCSANCMASYSVCHTLLLWGAYDNRQGLETGYSTTVGSCTYVSLLHKKHFPQTYFPIYTQVRIQLMVWKKECITCQIGQTAWRTSTTLGGGVRDTAVSEYTHSWLTHKNMALCVLFGSYIKFIWNLKWPHLHAQMPLISEHFIKHLRLLWGRRLQTKHNYSTVIDKAMHMQWYWHCHATREETCNWEGLMQDCWMLSSLGLILPLQAPQTFGMQEVQSATL